MGWKDFIALYIVGAIFVALMAFCVYSVHVTQVYDQDCRARGGVPYHSRESGNICLKPGTLL